MTTNPWEDLEDWQAQILADLCHEADIPLTDLATVEKLKDTFAFRGTVLAEAFRRLGRALTKENP